MRPAELPASAQERLRALVAFLARDDAAPTSVRDPERAWEVHVADSLTGLEIESLAGAGRIADVGAGAGFPGLVLAVALEAAEVDLIESVGRKCEFMRRAVLGLGIGNARVICERAETWALAGGREAYDAVTARAVGRLATLAELASPLLRPGGVLVAWKGRRDPDEEAELARSASALAMEPVDIVAVAPFAASRHRHLHVVRKAGPTPPGLPRRPGMAKKRPLGSRRR